MDLIGNEGDRSADEEGSSGDDANDVSMNVGEDEVESDEEEQFASADESDENVESSSDSD